MNTTATPATNEAATHTPTPWTLHQVIASESEQPGVLNIRAGDVNVFATTNRHGTSDHANAAHIVLAVNERPALLAERDNLGNKLNDFKAAFATADKKNAGLLARVAELEAALEKCAEILGQDDFYCETMKTVRTALASKNDENGGCK
jgi:hypothetical protein